MKTAYYAIFTAADDSKDTWLVEVPGLDIITEGYGINNAIEMARDAIALKLISQEDHNEEIQPFCVCETPIYNSKSKFIGKHITSLIDVDTVEYRRKIDNKSVRRNVTLPNWLNLEAERAHINVSRVLQEALMEKLNIQK